MADYNSSLPIRTEADGDVVIKICDGTTETQHWAIDASGRGLVKIQDASGNDLVIGSGGGITTIMTDGTNTVAIDASGNLSTLITDGTDTLAINTGGSINTVVTDGTDTIAIDSSGNLSTLITDGTNGLAINADGSLNVIIGDQVNAGEVHVYGTQASATPATPYTIVSYTVTALKTLQLKSVQAACSGAFKLEVKAGVSGSETTRAVAFGSTAGGNVQIDFAKNIEVVAGDKVLLIVTNRDKQTADVYGFINGAEL